jgi:esterase/lipase
MDVKIKTSDDLELAGTYNPGSGNLGILLLHMMPATKSSYDELASNLNQQGWHALAIDFRGHGSSQGGDYNSFTNEDHQKSILDVEAGVNFLKDKGISEIGLIGASIGANLAIKFASNNQAKFVVALSAGTEYRGVRAIDDIDKIKCPILLIATRDDQGLKRDPAQMANELFDKARGSKDIQIYDKGGHGTDLIANNPERQKMIVEWIKKIGI